MDIRKVSHTERGSELGLKKPQEGVLRGPSFAESLEQAESSYQVLTPSTEPPQLQESVKFSNHALERMLSRGIQFTQADFSRLNEAVQRASLKGSKNSLILMNDSALIISVRNKTVVTVMDKNALKENVFTNIDSTIVL